MHQSDSPDSPQEIKNITKQLSHVESEYLQAKEYVEAYAHDFRSNPLHLGYASSVAEHLSKQALTHHAIINQKVKQADGFPLLRCNVIIGNLPSADSLMSSLSSAFPMLTRPTPEQKCYLPPPNSSAIAINFVICKPLKLTQLLDYHSSEASMKRNGYSIEKKLYTPLRTYDTNNCIDFLPHHEYALFRVVPFIHEGDRENRLQLHPHPQKVIVFQGPPMATQSYSFASPTELALPPLGAHTFPIIRNEYGNNIIFNPVNNAPYDSTTAGFEA